MSSLYGEPLLEELNEAYDSEVKRQIQRLNGI